MKYLYLLLILSISSIAFAQPDLDFQTTQGGWTDGALSKLYTNVGTPPANVTVSVGGTTAAFASNSPQAIIRGLQLAVNHTSNTDCVTTTFTFNPAVQGLTFRLLNVDRGQASGTLYNFVDQVTVSGMNGAASVTPVISASGTAGTYSSISGNTVTGIGDAPASASDPGNQVVFAGTVTRVTITYCNNAAQTIANPGAQTITIEDLSWNAVAMPVHLISFQGKAVGNQVALDWETAWEENSDYFEVQRSQDAQEFSFVGRVASIGQSASQQTYSLLDQDPLAGTGYYRLKQVDKGTNPFVTYSKIIAVVLDDITPVLAVTGNPVEGEFVQIAFRNIDPHQLILHTVSGLAIPYRVSGESTTKAVLVPNQRLPPGLYLLSGQQGMTRLTVKVIVL